VDEIEQVFGIYDATRRPRTQRLVTTSREGEETYELENKDVDDDEEKLRHNLAKRQRWIWNHDLESDMVKAREMMQRQRVQHE
jgi:salicylate hydroxylase